MTTNNKTSMAVSDVLWTDASGNELSDNPETAWCDENGFALPDIQVDPEFVRVIDKEEHTITKYEEYCTMCRVGGEKPMNYAEWVDFDLRYLEHLRTTPNPVTPVTFERIEKAVPVSPEVVALQAKVKQLEEEKSLLRKEFHSSEDIYSDMLSKERSSIEELQTRFDLACSQRDNALQSKFQAEIETTRIGQELIVLREENERLNQENAELLEDIEKVNKQLLFIQRTPANQPLFPHYYRQVPETTTHVDIYWVLKAWDVTDPCVAHAAKKLLCVGKRGAKDSLQDLEEARDSINRAIELEQTK